MHVCMHECVHVRLNQARHSSTVHQEVEKISFCPRSTFYTDSIYPRLITSSEKVWSWRQGLSVGYVQLKSYKWIWQHLGVLDGGDYYISELQKCLQLDILSLISTRLESNRGPYFDIYGPCRSRSSIINISRSSSSFEHCESSDIWDIDDIDDVTYE